MTRWIKPYFGMAISLASLFVILCPVYGDNEQVVGWIEKACIVPGHLVIPAKVDTGAVSCSLHAPDLIEFERGGEKWVKFTIVGEDGKKAVIEKRVVGERKIKRHFGQFQNRPVIRLAICVGNVHRTSEVNLVDRTGFEYPLLIGRNFMDGRLVVNPSVMYTVEPSCAEH